MLIALLLTIFTLILIPVYWRKYGVENFLWFSDIGLFLTVAALWLDSPLLMSIAAVALLVPELIWNFDFFIELLTPWPCFGLACYMFDSQYSLLLRGLSLFHVVLPIFWVWGLVTWGYDPRAFWYATQMCWIVLLITYLFTKPKSNINYVFMPEKLNWNISSRMWLLLLMVAFPILLYLPMHILFLQLFVY